MKLDYLDIKTMDIIADPPVCQCGTKLFYSDKLHSLICSNPDCIKTRMQSVMSTLKALDRLAKIKGQTPNLFDLAKQDYDRLVCYVETCGIKHGAELITLGKNLDDLGQLGTQLGIVIDTLQFEIDELANICGSSLLEKFNVAITKLNDNQRQSVLEINTQLGIDGAIWLAQILYEEYNTYKQHILKLTEYLTLVRPAHLKRSAVPLVIPYVEADSLFDELQELDHIDDVLIPSDETLDTTQTTNASNDDTSNEEDATLLEELLDW